MDGWGSWRTAVRAVRQGNRSATEVGGVVLGDHRGSGVDVGLHRLATDRVERRLSPHLAHLRRELGHGPEFGACNDCFDLIGSGIEADRLGIVSQALPAAELETTVTGMAREIASRHLATLEHAKIAVQMDRDLTLSQAIQLDMLVGARMKSAMDPTVDVDSYLKSQKGGPNMDYKRPDV